jgi:outer membrane protein OmpA-like peptidoglycan-associated protein
VDKLAPIKAIQKIDNNRTKIVEEEKKESFIDISVKAYIEDNGSVKISGVVPTLEDKTKIEDAYGKVFEKVDSVDLTVDENSNPKSGVDADLLSNFASYLSKFKSGYISYESGEIEIDGTTYDRLIKDDLDEVTKVLTSKGVEVANHLSLEEEPPKEFPWREIIDESRELDENITIKNDQNVSDRNDSKPDINETLKESDDRDKNSSSSIKMPTIEELQAKIDKIMKNSRVEFLYAKDIMTKKSKKVVDKIADILKENNSTIIEIGGHTDSDGTKERNLKLSKRRANAVKEYLIKRGIKASRLKAVGYGESKPKVPNTSRKNKRVNRRVEFTIVGESQ